MARLRQPFTIDLPQCEKSGHARGLVETRWDESGSWTRQVSLGARKMREFAVAIILSVFVAGVTLILPYSVNTTPLSQTVTVREAAPLVEKRPAAPAPTAHGHVQMAQATATGGD